MKFPHLKLITLDLDETLWPCKPVIMQAETILHQWLSEKAPRLAAEYDVASLRAHRIQVTKVNPQIAHNLTLTRQQSLEILLQKFGYDTALAAQAVNIFRIERNKVTPYEDVTQVLITLARHYHLISVTNGNAEVDETPLRGYFSHSLTAELVGASKPDPLMFQRAMQLADVTAEQTLHVGDDPRTDIDAAWQAGIQSIWVNRKQAEWPAQYRPALATITDLHELPRLLEIE